MQHNKERKHTEISNNVLVHRLTVEGEDDVDEEVRHVVGVVVPVRGRSLDAAQQEADERPAQVVCNNTKHVEFSN